MYTVYNDTTVHEGMTYFVYVHVLQLLSTINFSIDHNAAFV